MVDNSRFSSLSTIHCPLSIELVVVEISGAVDAQIAQYAGFRIEDNAE